MENIEPFDKTNAPVSRIYEKAKQGDARALSDMGLMHYTGNGVAFSHVLAYQWWYLAFNKEGGDVAARERAADGLDKLEKEMTQQQIDLAHALIKEVSAHEARVNPITSDIRFVNPPKEDSSSLSLKPYRQEINQDGWMQFKTKFAINESSFKEVYQKAEQGDAYARFNLGIMYYTGDGVEASKVYAYKWWYLVFKEDGGGVRGEDIVARDWAARALDELQKRSPLTSRQIILAKQLVAEEQSKRAQRDSKPVTLRLPK